MARFTTGGPAAKTWPCPRTITLKCESTARPATCPAEGPTMAEQTGTLESSSASRAHWLPSGRCMRPASS